VLKTAWIDPKLYQKWYDLGYSDQAIAEKINVTVGAVFKWRKRNNIPANFDQKLTRLPIQFATLKANGSYDILYIHTNIRSSLGWKPEDRLQVEIIDGELRITVTVQRLRRTGKLLTLWKLRSSTMKVKLICKYPKLWAYLSEVLKCGDIEGDFLQIG